MASPMSVFFMWFLPVLVGYCGRHPAIAGKACTSRSHVSRATHGRAYDPYGSLAAPRSDAPLCYERVMNKGLLIAATLALAATSAAAQVGPGAVGSMGGNGAITNIGAGGYGARTQPPADLRPSTPAATEASPSSAAIPA